MTMLKGLLLWLLTATIIWVVGNIISYHVLGAKLIETATGFIYEAHNVPVTFLASVVVAFVFWLGYKIFG